MDATVSNVQDYMCCVIKSKRVVHGFLCSTTNAHVVLGTVRTYSSPANTDVLAPVFQTKGGSVTMTRIQLVNIPTFAVDHNGWTSGEESTAHRMGTGVLAASRQMNDVTDTPAGFSSALLRILVRPTVDTVDGAGGGGADVE